MLCAGTSRGITSGLGGLHLGQEQVRLCFPGAEQTTCLCCRQQQSIVLVRARELWAVRQCPHLPWDKSVSVLPGSSGACEPSSAC